MKNTNEKYIEEIIEERFNGYDVYDPFEGEEDPDMKNTDKAQEAFERWQYLAEKNAETDYKVNRLLRLIANDLYDLYDELDNPIWDIIHMLTDEQLDAFIDGCLQI